MKNKYKCGGLVNPFDLGGLMSGAGSIASMLPGAGTVVGAGLGLVGNLISGNSRKKELEKQQDNALMQQRQEIMLKQPQSSKGVVPGVANPYMLAMGGLTNSELETYDNGGLHEENPNGGIPLGMSSNGNLDTVEQGEASFNFEDGKYVFSNRLILD